MTSKIVVNNIEADAGVSTVFFNSDIGATDGTLNVDGNLTVDGVITYEDVTNVDSVGIITARSGLHVTGGSVGIGNSGDFGFFTNANDRTLILGTGNGSGAIQVHSGGTSYGGLYFGDSTSGNARYSGYVEYKHDENFLRFATAEVERLRITSAGNIGVGGLTTPGALLSIPAGESNTPRLAIESAVDDNDFTITQYEDGNGTYTMLGQNVKLNSGGNTTVLDSGHRTAGMQLDARHHGAITFVTGAANAATERLHLNSDGKLILSMTGRTTPFISGDGGMCIEQSYDGNLRALTIRNKDTGASAATSLGFSLNRSGGDYDFLGGEIKLVKEQTWTTTDTTIDSAMTFSTTANNALTERLRITSDGKIGIGSDTPSAKLDIYRSGSGAAARFGKETIFGELQVDGQRIGIQGKRSSDNAVSGFFVENPTSTGTSNFELVTIKTAGTERLRINSAGNVTIGGKVDPGWNSTVDALTVGYAGVFYEDSYSVGGVAGRDNYLIIGNNTRYAPDGQNKYINNDEAMRIYMHAGTLAYQNAAAGSGGNNITFTDRLHITPTGNMRIGDSSVTFSDNNAYYSNAWSSTDGYNTFLTIASTEYANIRFRGNHSTDAEFTIGVGNGTYYMAYDEIGNTHLLTAIASTGVVSGDLNDTSDEKLKENITSIADGQIDIIKQLRPVNFDWKKGTLKGQSGFIAQEIKAVIPDLVQGEEYDENDFGSVGYSVNTNGLVSHLTKALQEAISKIEALENRLTDAGL